MHARTLAVVIALMLGLAAGGAVTASGAGPAVVRSDPPKVPRAERTHPHLRPLRGGPHTPFAVHFRLRETLGHQGFYETAYSVGVSRGPRSSPACAPPQPARVESGSAGELVRVGLTPPPGGWCAGRHRVTVYLERGPYCPPPSDEGQPLPCPAFATQQLDTGEAIFVVEDGSDGT